MLLRSIELFSLQFNQVDILLPSSKNRRTLLIILLDVYRLRYLCNKKSTAPVKMNQF